MPVKRASRCDRSCWDRLFDHFEDRFDIACNFRQFIICHMPLGSRMPSISDLKPAWRRQTLLDRGDVGLQCQRAAVVGVFFSSLSQRSSIPANGPWREKTPQVAHRVVIDPSLAAHLWRIHPFLVKRYCFVELAHVDENLGELVFDQGSPGDILIALR
jgi:hypothetical protein